MIYFSLKSTPTLSHTHSSQFNRSSQFTLRYCNAKAVCQSFPFRAAVASHHSLVQLPFVRHAEDILPSSFRAISFVPKQGRKALKGCLNYFNNSSITQHWPQPTAAASIEGIALRGFNKSRSKPMDPRRFCTTVCRFSIIVFISFIVYCACRSFASFFHFGRVTVSAPSHWPLEEDNAPAPAQLKRNDQQQQQNHPEEWA